MSVNVFDIFLLFGEGRVRQFSLKLLLNHHYYFFFFFSLMPSVILLAFNSLISNLLSFFFRLFPFSHSYSISSFFFFLSFIVQFSFLAPLLRQPILFTLVFVSFISYSDSVFPILLNDSFSITYQPFAD